MLRHARTVGLTAAAAGLAAFAWAGPALAAFGDPDLIWGAGGVATADIAGVSSEGATALSGDTAGGANAFGSGRDNRGRVETAALWQNDGQTVTTRTQRLNLGSFGEAEPPVSVARQPDGKFVTTGSVRGAIGTPVHVSRFNANGTLDTSFSGDATTFFPLPSGVLGLTPTAVAVQDDGKIVSVATSTNQPARIAVGRLTATGLLDTSLGGSGSLALADPAALDERAGGVATDADTIYVSGDARLRDGRQGFVLYRLSKADGSLVSRTFTEVTAPDGGTPRATDLLRLADGRLVVAGGLENGTRGVSQGALVAYQKSGEVDYRLRPERPRAGQGAHDRVPLHDGVRPHLRPHAHGRWLRADRLQERRGRDRLLLGRHRPRHRPLPEYRRQGDDDRHHDGLRTGQAARRRL